MEILVALVLLSSMGVITLNAFSTTAQMTNTDQGVAYSLGRSILERMHEYVRQDQWGNASLPLSLTTPGPQNIASTVNGKNYTVSYRLNNSPNTGTAPPLDTNGDGIEDYRRVTVTVNF